VGFLFGHFGGMSKAACKLDAHTFSDLKKDIPNEIRNVVAFLERDYTEILANDPRIFF
jgi:hypothetical protein